MGLPLNEIGRETCKERFIFHGHCFEPNLNPFGGFPRQRSVKASEDEHHLLLLIGAKRFVFLNLLL